MPSSVLDTGDPVINKSQSRIEKYPQSRGQHSVVGAMTEVSTQPSLREQGAREGDPSTEGGKIGTWRGTGCSRSRIPGERNGNSNTFGQPLLFVQYELIRQSLEVIGDKAKPEDHMTRLCQARLQN